MGSILRHENKYMISGEAAALLKLRLPHVMGRDRNARQTGQYTIRSLYYDNPEYCAFREKVDGVDHRIKYRIRCYNDVRTLFKLEKKEKHGSMTRKTAETLTRAEVELLQKNPVSLQRGAEGSLLEELRLLCTGCGMRPAVLVEYDRTPFVCAAGNTRVTIDENLRTRLYTRDIFASSHSMIPVMEPDQVILEVKFDEFLPGYLSDLLEDIPKAPMAISKFAMCLNLY